MPYQRLQVSRALKVKPTSADINVSPDIPDPDFAGLSGTNASVTANKLVKIIMHLPLVLFSQDLL